MLHGVRLHAYQAQFRSQHVPVPELQQEVAQFFGAGPAPAPLASQVPMSMISIPAQPFDVSGLRDALPVVTAPVQRPQISGTANAAWAADFLAHQPATSTHASAQTHAHAPQGQGQAQAIPADAQHDRMQSSALPMGGLQSASMRMRVVTCFADLFFLFILFSRCFSILPWRLALGGAPPWSPVYAGYARGPMIGFTSAMAQRHVVQNDRESR